MKTNRVAIVDQLKGLAIILVVIGHFLVVSFPNNYEAIPVFRFCYSFHMPLFVVMSGFVTGMRGFDRCGESWLGKRLVRLMVPNVVWTVVSMIYYRCEQGLLYYIFIEPYFWFLTYLVANDICTYLIAKVKHKLLFGVGIYAFICVLRRYVNIAVLNDLYTYYPFYYLGFFTCSFGKKMRVKRDAMVAIIICAAVYPFAMWFYTHEASFALTISRIQAVCGTIGFTLPDTLAKMLAIVLNRYIIALIGICFAWVCISIVVRILPRVGDSLAYIGNHTMSVYLVHMIILRIVYDLFPGSVPGGIAAVIVAIGIPLVLEWGCAKCRYIGRILFG